MRKLSQQPRPSDARGASESSKCQLLVKVAVLTRAWSHSSVMVLGGDFAHVMLVFLARQNAGFQHTNSVSKEDDSEAEDPAEVEILF